MDNVIPAIFAPSDHEAIYVLIKTHGAKWTESLMIHAGHHSSFAKAAIRRIMRHRGW